MSDSEQGSAHPAPLRIVNPDATPEEVAAIVAVFAAMQSTPAAAKKPVAAWADNRRSLRPQHPHGRGGWRASSLPR